MFQFTPTYNGRPPRINGTPLFMALYIDQMNKKQWIENWDHRHLTEKMLGTLSLNRSGFTECRWSCLPYFRHWAYQGVEENSSNSKGGLSEYYNNKIMMNTYTEPEKNLESGVYPPPKIFRLVLVT